MTIEPNVEIGVDYDGNDKRHLQTNELKIFTNEKHSRVFTLENGSFYVDSLRILDYQTNKELVKGIDYEVLILDEVASSKSGKEVCGVIHVTNMDVGGVILDYQFVGGKHSSGLYILNNILKMYPNGSSSHINFFDIIGNADKFNPSYHTHHVNDVVNTRELLIALERLRANLVKRSLDKLSSMYSDVDNRLNNVRAKLNSFNGRYKDIIDNIQNTVGIQSEEYILTDNPENPRIRRGYGEWEQIKDTILFGIEGGLIVGSGTVIDMGNEELIRNCYIWKNIADDGRPKPKVTLNPSKVRINEGESITVNIVTENINDGTILNWEIKNATTNDFDNVSGFVTIVGNRASLTFTSIEDMFSEGDEEYKFVIKQLTTANFLFTVVDTSKSYPIKSVNYVNLGNNAITNIIEGNRFRLLINTDGMVGQRVNLRWSDSTIDLSLVEGLVDNIEITDKLTYLDLSIKNNGLAGENKVLTVKASVDNSFINVPTSSLSVIDTNLNVNFNYSFLKDGALVNEINEGDTFTIRITPTTQVKNTFTIGYKSDSQLNEFKGLVRELVLDGQPYVDIPNVTKTKNNGYLDTYLEISINGSKAQLLIRKGFIDPEYNVYWSDSPTGEAITTFTERDRGSVYLIFESSRIGVRPENPLTTITLGGARRRLDTISMSDNPTLDFIFGIEENKISYVDDGRRRQVIKFDINGDDRRFLGNDYLNGTYTIDGIAGTREIPRLNFIDETNIVVTPMMLGNYVGEGRWFEIATEIKEGIGTDFKVDNDFNHNTHNRYLLAFNSGTKFLEHLDAEKIFINIEVDTAKSTAIEGEDFTIGKKILEYNQRFTSIRWTTPVYIKSDHITEGEETIVLKLSFNNPDLNKFIPSEYVITIKDGFAEVSGSFVLAPRPNELINFDAKQKLTFVGEESLYDGSSVKFTDLDNLAGDFGIEFPIDNKPLTTLTDFKYIFHLDLTGTTNFRPKDYRIQYQVFNVENRAISPVKEYVLSYNPPGMEFSFWFTGTRTYLRITGCVYAGVYSVGTKRLASGYSFVAENAITIDNRFSSTPDGEPSYKSSTELFVGMLNNDGSNQSGEVVFVVNYNGEYGSFSREVTVNVPTS